MNLVFCKNRSMLLALWLIAMQMVAPFMHAHPSGIGAVTGAGLHVHMSDEMDLDTLPSSDHHSAQVNIHTEVMHQHIVAVASGIAEKLKLDLTSAALLLVIIWAIFDLACSRHHILLASPRIKRRPNRTQSPRAPPALN